MGKKLSNKQKLWNRFARNWIRNLRTTKIKKCEEQLFKYDSDGKPMMACALGIAIMTAQKMKIQRCTTNYKTHPGAWFERINPEGKSDPIITNGGKTVSECNDEGMSFKQVSNLLERKYFPNTRKK